MPNRLGWKLSENEPIFNISPIIIALGSNIEPERHLKEAVQMLATRVYIRAASRVYESDPVDASGSANPDQEHFLNAALWIETPLRPSVLKYDVLRQIETDLGRVRTEDKYAPRPIDLDLVLYGNLIIERADPYLRLPDPDTLTRAYIAMPLADLAPDFIHPLIDVQLATIAARFAWEPTIRIREDIHLLP